MPCSWYNGRVAARTQAYREKPAIGSPPTPGAARVLVVDDEEVIVESIRDYFDDRPVTVFCDPEQALQAMRQSFFDIAVVDYRMPGLSGLDLLIEAKKINSYHYGILLTAFADKDLLERFISHNLIRLVLEKPLDLKRLKEALDRATEECRTFQQDLFEQEQKRLHYEQLLSDTTSLGPRIIGLQGGLKEIFEQARRFAGSDANLLITGETGTGKEVIARAVHTLSDRRTGPFVKINCGAMPESLIESELFGHAKGAYSGAYQDRKGKVETAQGGTLFLDEIGELKPELQVRLLHVIQDRVIERLGSNTPIRVDFRLITATNRDLRQEVGRGGFREDLYHRVSTLPLHMPPLRQRPEDLPEFLAYYLEAFGQELHRSSLKVSDGAFRLLSAYPWPGNIRELENVLKRAVILARPGEDLLDEDLFTCLTCPPTARGVSLDDVFDTLCEQLDRRAFDLKGLEERLLERLLERYRGNIMEAVRATGIPKDKLYRLKQGE